MRRDWLKVTTKDGEKYFPIRSITSINETSQNNLFDVGGLTQIEINNIIYVCQEPIEYFLNQGE